MDTASFKEFPLLTGQVETKKSKKKINQVPGKIISNNQMTSSMVPQNSSISHRNQNSIQNPNTNRNIQMMIQSNASKYNKNIVPIQILNNNKSSQNMKSDKINKRHNVTNMFINTNDYVNNLRLKNHGCHKTLLNDNGVSDEFIENELYRVRCNQVNYYFSNNHLKTNAYFQSLMNNQGYVNLNDILNFSRLKSLKTTYDCLYKICNELIFPSINSEGYERLEILKQDDEVMVRRKGLEKHQISMLNELHLNDVYPEQNYLKYQKYINIAENHKKEKIYYNYISKEELSKKFQDEEKNVFFDKEIFSSNIIKGIKLENEDLFIDPEIYNKENEINNLLINVHIGSQIEVPKVSNLHILKNHEELKCDNEKLVNGPTTSQSKNTELSNASNYETNEMVMEKSLFVNTEREKYNYKIYI